MARNYAGSRLIRLLDVIKQLIHNYKMNSSWVQLGAAIHAFVEPGNSGSRRSKAMRGLAKLGIVAALAATVAFGTAASAAGWGGHGQGRGFGPGPRPGMGYAPRAAWNGGHWFHGNHGGRAGWWWNVGSAWYLYPQPVYPYPAYAGYGYAPPYGDDTPYDRNYLYYTPDQFGLYQPEDRGNSTEPYTYYCENPRGYYPEVLDCDNWQQLYMGKPVHYD
jgi:hypothetical protein